LTRTKQSFVRSAAELAAIVVVALGLALGVQAWLVKPYQIPSGSMEPTLKIGQRILVDRVGMHFASPHVGEVMVFHPPVDTTYCADPKQGQMRSGVFARQACDVVGTREASVTFVKRVVGLPGDHLRIVNGHVFRNGKKESAPYAMPCDGGSECDFPGTIVVPKGDYYMMGDNRPDSEDSRFWGPVPRSWLIGGVFFTYWPLDRVGFL
jgi:signal peptidase I